MPKTRRQQAAEAANAAAPAEPPAEDGAAAPEPPKRKTTARKPRGKKTAEAAAAEVPEVPLGEQLAAVQAEAAAKAAATPKSPVSPAAASAAAAAAAALAVPAEDKPAAAAPNPATSALVTELTADALHELPEGTDDDQVRAMLYETAINLHGKGVGPDDLDDDQKAEIVQAVVMLLAPPPEEAPPEEEAPPASAAAAAAAAPPPSPAALLAEARRRQASSASAAAAAAAAASPAGTEEEDSPLSPNNVLSIKVPITAAAKQYIMDVITKPPPPPSPGAAPMSQEAESLSLGAMSVESPIADKDALSIRWYPVHSEARVPANAEEKVIPFPEKLGERFNLIFPAHKMNPISWADMKEGHRINGETYYAFTVAEAAPGSVLGSDYTLLSDDPKKVIAAGVINTYTHPAMGRRVANILDMGAREDTVSTTGAVNPYLEMALKSMAQRLPPNALIRYSCKQEIDFEFLSRMATLHACGLPLSQWTRTGELKDRFEEAAIKPRGAKEAETISAVKLRPSKTGPARILYEHRDEKTGAVKSFDGAAVDKVQYTTGSKVKGAQWIEFVGLASSVLAEGGEDRDITLPEDILKDKYKQTDPRRGGRKRTQRKRKTSSRR